eukprot:TRINITY_DN6184_c0_g1_i1.p1 TRINITY_DN6184_c0_g1~~TRINITY_DN6184_c0_g1_i1.p1  ORF type:complete len:260 (+),score=65.68 TRINITY_DN6184_c0_g1_i1:55-834(+)
MSTRGSSLEKLGAALKKWNALVVKLKKDSSKFGTAQDNGKFRDQNKANRSKAINFSDKIGEKIKAISQNPKYKGEGIKTTVAKLNKDYSQISEKLKKILKDTRQKEKDFLLNEAVETISPLYNESGGPTDQHRNEFTRGRPQKAAQQQQVQQEIEFTTFRRKDFENTLEVQEEAKKIEKDMANLKDIMVDLGGLVEKTGEKIDQIDENVQITAMRVDKGNENVEDAINYQKKSRKKMCFLIIGAVIFCLLMLAPILHMA